MSDIAPVELPEPAPAPVVDPVVPTQVKKPWRATVRTIFAMVVSVAAMAPIIYTAATKQDPELASGYAAGALAIAAAVTRVLALPAVESFLQKWLPWLSADSPAWH